MTLCACSNTTDGSTSSKVVDLQTPETPNTEETTTTQAVPESDTSQQQTAISEATVSIQQQDITYLADHENTELVSFSFQIPQITSPQTTATENINNAFRASYEHSVALADGTAAGSEGDLLYQLVPSAYELFAYLGESAPAPYYYGESHSIQRIDSVIFSSLSARQSYSGGAHGSNIQYGVNYSMETGEPVTLSDLTDDTEAFTAYCMEQLLILSEERQDELFPNYTESISDIITDDTFYFSQEGLCFISQEYMLQPYAAGTIIFCIPYEQLHGYLREEFFPSDTSWSFDVTTQTLEPIEKTYTPESDDAAVTP